MQRRGPDDRIRLSCRKGPQDIHESHRPRRDRRLCRRVHRAGGLAGLALAGAEGLFPGREQYPDLGRDDLDRGDRDQHRHVPERPRRGLRRRFPVPATGLRVSVRPGHRRHGPPAGLFPRGDLHRLSAAEGSLRRADPDDGVDPLPRGPLPRRRPPALPRVDGARASHRLAARGGHRGRGGDHHRLYLPRRDEGRDLDRRHPVQRVYPRRRGGPGDPGEQAHGRLDRAVPQGPTPPASSSSWTSPST